MTTRTALITGGAGGIGRAMAQALLRDGHRVAATDVTRADEYELVVMRRAAELLPIQRRLEEEMFGVSTT